MSNANQGRLLLLGGHHITPFQGLLWNASPSEGRCPIVGIFNVRVPSATHRKISLLAAKKGIKLNDLVNRSLDYLVNNEDKVLTGTKKP